MPTNRQSASSFAQTVNPYVKLSYHQIFVPLQFIIPLTPFPLSIFIKWISGHSAIAGNELAGKVAKEASTIVTNTILPISFSSSIQVINEIIHDDPPTHERVVQVHQHQKASHASLSITKGFLRFQTI